MPFFKNLGMTSRISEPTATRFCGSELGHSAADTQWFSERSFNWPSSKHAHFKCLRVHVEKFSPFRDAHRSVVPCQQAGITSIAILNTPKHPSAIGWFVIAIVIDAVDRMLRRWSLTHIGKECRVGVAPSLANTDAAPAPETVAFGSRIRAALDHLGPAIVFGCAFSHVATETTTF